MFTVAQIEQAHADIKSGADFPNYIRTIKALHVTSFETWVSDSHTEYFGKDGYSAKSGPKYSELTVSCTPQPEAFAHHLKVHQQGATDYYTFCRQCAETGIEKWFVCLDAMTCTYYDRAGKQILMEAIPR
jgi:uncharacterized protein YbcV (DUF1398 family)